MDASSRNMQSNVAQVGAAAKALLLPGERGRVLAALSSTAYLLTASQQLFWVASAWAPMHRRCLRLCTMLPRLVSGAPFWVDDSRLRIDPGFVVHHMTASLWRPPQVDRDEVVEVALLAGHVRALAASLDSLPAHGFGQCLPELMGRRCESAGGRDDPVIRLGRPLLLNLMDAWRSRDGKRIARDAEALVGFGSGLTPSGDDFLGGLLFGVQTLRASYPSLDLPDAAIIGEAHRQRTNAISFSLLDDLARGHAVEPLHHVVNGILRGERPESLHPTILQLIGIGHSTGWDMLSGLLAGLLLSEEGERV